MEQKSDIIKQACELLLTQSKDDVLTLIDQNYKFVCPEIDKRHYNGTDKMSIFIRDGFIDRYSGKSL